MISFIENLKNTNTRNVEFCTDNCANIKVSISNSEKETISQVEHLLILRIPCEIRSTLLFIAAIKKDPRSELSTFFTSVQSLISRLHDKSIKKTRTGKVPI